GILGLHVTEFRRVLFRSGNTTVLAQRLSAVAALNVLYEGTTLTATERTNFEAFKQLCQTIAQNDEVDNRPAALRAAREAAERLQILSSIQVEEGKNLLDEVLSMTYFSNILSYLELIILIIIAVIIQALVFSSKT